MLRISYHSCDLLYNQDFNDEYYNWARRPLMGSLLETHNVASLLSINFIPNGKFTIYSCTSCSYFFYAIFIIIFITILK